MWLNIRKFQLLEGLSDNFLGPCVGPFKVLEKKLPDIYKLKLLENLKVHPIFHVLLLKLVAHYTSKLNQKYNSRPLFDFIDNEPEFEVEVVLNSRQLRGENGSTLVKWKGYHPIEAPWVNESNMEHAQEAIEEFHNGSAKKQKKHIM